MLERPFQGVKSRGQPLGCGLERARVSHGLPSYGPAAAATPAPPTPVKLQGFANETYVAFHGAVNARRSCGQNNVVDLSWIWRPGGETVTRQMAAAPSAALESRSL